jgi:hypothetical protein
VSVRLYASTDASAPVLTGASGSLLSVLVACLGTGYGAQQGAGWTQVFTGTNKGVFRSTSGLFYRVQDDVQGGAGIGANAIVNGYATMSDVDTGTNPFPATVGDAYISKAVTANDGASHPWLVLADGITAYVFVDCDNAGRWVDAGWGALSPFTPFDGFAQFVGGANNTISNPHAGPFRFFSGIGTSGQVARARTDRSVLALQRSYTGAGGAMASDPYGHSAVSYYGDMAWTEALSDSAGLAIYPTAGQILLAEIHVGETALPTVRAKLRGLWHWGHPYAAVADADTFSGGPGGALFGLPGRTFRIVKPVGASSLFVLETSDTWDLPT